MASNQTTRSEKLTILYGSQTGNAEDMAKRIGQLAKSLGFTKLLVQAIDDFQLKQLPKQKLVIFVCATTGHGQEPENMKNFYNFIRRRDLPNDCLNGLEFAVYGLGSSSYAKFNYVSKIVYKRIKECGAKAVQELVASDEQHQFGCDGLIYPRLKELWTKLGFTEREIDAAMSPFLQIKPPLNSYDVKYYDKSQYVPSICDKFSPDFKLKNDIKKGICYMNQRLTHEDHFQDTRLLCFKAEDRIHYEPGDVCAIYPKNDELNVQELIRLLKLDPKQRIRVIKKYPDYMVDYLYDFIPDGLEIQDVIRYYLDIQSVPKRSFFEYLWPFSDDQMECDKLKEFASTEGQEELYEYCIRPKRTILETMLDFPKTVERIKFEYIFDLIPPIKARSFSIASSFVKHSGEIHLLVGVVNYKTSMRKLRQGLCSNYLANMTTVDQPETLRDNCELRFFIRQTSFKLPKGDPQVPIIMVGPGLGLSPFRSFIEHLDSLQSIERPTSVFLYFGCRYRERDYYFKRELEEYALKGLISLRVAFSREQPKEYVQDLLAQDAELIYQLIQEEKATVYVAGNSKLPEELRRLIGKLLAKQTGDSGEQEENFEKSVMELESVNRIQYDCW